MEVKFIDLFAGIGGIRLGFEQAAQSLDIQSTCVMSSEINPASASVYQQNFGDYPHGDIRVIDQIPACDVLLAGFPCQTFSYAGKKAGFEETRGTLFFEILRLIDTCSPQAFLFENVRGLVSHDSGKTLAVIQSEMERRGYSFELFLLNSSNFGVPQNRVRTYMLGIKNQKPRFGLVSDPGPKDSHSYNSSQLSLFANAVSHCNVRSVLEEDPPEKYNCSDLFVNALQNALHGDLGKLHGKRLIDYRGGNSLHSWELGLRGKCSADEINLMNLFITKRRNKCFGRHQDGKLLTEEQIATFFEHPDLAKILGSLVKKKYLQIAEGKYKPVAGNFSFEVYKFLDPEKISVTLVSSDANRIGVYHNGRVRRITPREAARLQGFPDQFMLHPEDSHAYVQLGNSVTVPVVKAVCQELISKVLFYTQQRSCAIAS